MQPLRAAMTDAIERLRTAVEPGADERDAEYARQRDSMLRADRMRRLRDAGASLPADMAKAIVSGATPARTTSGRGVASWFNDPAASRLLVLTGGVGCGKTTAACWAIAQHDRGGRIRSASVIAMAWRSISFATERARDEWATCGLLVIDDVGAEHQHNREWVAVALRDLLELRQADGLRTILTSNLARAELEQTYNDQRLSSRLARARWVADSGNDLRRKR